MTRFVAMVLVVAELMNREIGSHSVLYASFPWSENRLDVSATLSQTRAKTSVHHGSVPSMNMIAASVQQDPRRIFTGIIVGHVWVVLFERLIP